MNRVEAKIKEAARVPVLDEACMAMLYSVTLQAFNNPSDVFLPLTRSLVFMIFPKIRSRKSFARQISHMAVPV